MARDHEDLIDLGAASVETQGGSGPKLDVIATQPQAGLAED